ncbi:general stress protein [Propionicicella superfundia]|uniref:general stress protein n=1 Tax=Propionicicella superfundia TaxID=348582 RepID=UPI0004256A0E|nr:general stress protein [Propionicicella superfundia]
MTQPAAESPFDLAFPQSIATYPTYAEAQRAVDFLSDEKFPVENLAIVGTDLRLMERVTGRRTWGTVLRDGAINGLGTGLLVALLFFLFFPGSTLLLFVSALLIGVVISVIFGAVAYALSSGRRDFNSIAKTVATSYEVLCEHKVAEQAREMLLRLPGARAAEFE